MKEAENKIIEAQNIKVNVSNINENDLGTDL